jgi:hypothetical protein
MLGKRWNDARDMPLRKSQKEWHYGSPQHRISNIVYWSLCKRTHMSKRQLNVQNEPKKLFVKLSCRFLPGKGLKWLVMDQQLLLKRLWVAPTCSTTEKHVINLCSAHWVNISRKVWNNKNWTARNTGVLKRIVWVLTTCHTQYTWDRNICIFLFNRTTSFCYIPYRCFICAPFVILQTSTRYSSSFHTKRFLTSVRRHLSKLRSKRINT